MDLCVLFNPQIEKDFYRNPLSQSQLLTLTINTVIKYMGGAIAINTYLKGLLFFNILYRGMEVFEGELWYSAPAHCPHMLYTHLASQFPQSTRGSKALFCSIPVIFFVETSKSNYSFFSKSIHLLETTCQCDLRGFAIRSTEGNTSLVASVSESFC